MINKNVPKLTKALTVKQVEEAIKTSGYPLQKKVAVRFLEYFDVEEEWCFRDKDTNEYRTIDVIAEKYLYLKDMKRIHLSIAVECKQSHLPYVFFVNEQTSTLSNFPLITGLKKENIKGTDGYYRSVVDYLRLSSDQFVTIPPRCSNFSRCEMKGSKVVLSGSTPFNGVVMPLLKAILKLKDISVAPTNPNFLEFSSILGLGIIDGPMMEVVVDGDKQTIKPVNWIRVTRHEPHEKWGWMYGNNLYGLDIVNINYLDQYIEKHLLPFTERLVSTVLTHEKALLSGKE